MAIRAVKTKRKGRVRVPAPAPKRRIRGGASLTCPVCGAATYVVETRAFVREDGSSGVWRRRRCARHAKHVVHSIENECDLDFRVQR